MKHFNKLLAAAVLLVGTVLIGGYAFAQNDDEGAVTRYFSDEKLAKIEDNLVVALAHHSPGVQASAAQTLRQLKMYNPDYPFSESIIPLMAIVKKETCCQTARICAALALHDLKSERGDFAISQTGRFTDDEKLKRMCFWLAYDRQIEKSIEDAAVTGTIPLAIL